MRRYARRALPLRQGAAVEGADATDALVTIGTVNASGEVEIGDVGRVIRALGTQLVAEILATIGQLELAEAASLAAPATGYVRLAYSAAGALVAIFPGGATTPLATLGVLGSGDTALDGYSTIDAGLAGFGDGSDGLFEITGSYTLTRDMFWDELIVRAGAVVNTAGYRIFCKTKLVWAGTIRCNGAHASGATGGAGAPAGYYPGGGAGGNGGTAVSPGGNGGTVAQAAGGSGGAGGASSGGTSGGTAGTATVPAADYGGVGAFPQAITGRVTNASGTTQPVRPGGGGGGGGGHTNGNGGGGGGGGGYVGISAFEIVAASTAIGEANGGNGAQGLGLSTGGGGAGGGGVLAIHGAKWELDPAAVFRALAGSPGATGGGASAGASGAVGKVIMLGARSAALPAFTARSVDFTTLATGVHATLPGDLVLRRASASYPVDASDSVQTSESTIVTGIGAHLARVGRAATANAKSLVFEESRRNVLLFNRDIGTTTPAGPWGGDTFCTTTLDYAAGPDGQVKADRSQVASSGTSRQSAGAGTTPHVCFSVWLRHATGSGTYQTTVLSATAGHAVAGTADTTWRRITAEIDSGVADTVTYTLADGRNQTVYGGVGSGARDIVTDCAQIESGHFPTEYIVVHFWGDGGSGIRRPGEYLYHPEALDWLHAGRLNLLVRLRAKGASTEYSAPLRLWTIGSDFAEIDHATRKLRVSIAGNVWESTSTFTWARGDLLEIFVATGGATYVSRGRYRVNGGAAASVGDSTGAQPAIAATSGQAIDLLCRGTGADAADRQFTAWVEYFETFAQSDAPLWAQT